MEVFPISSIERDVDKFTKLHTNSSCNSFQSFMYWLTIADPCTGGGSGVMKSMRGFFIYGKNNCLRTFVLLIFFNSLYSIVNYFFCDAVVADLVLHPCASC